MSVLESSACRGCSYVAGRSERDGSCRYAPGKMDLKEVLGQSTITKHLHLQACGSRVGTRPRAGIRQGRLVRMRVQRKGDYCRPREEFALVRSASLALFAPFPEAASGGRGVQQKEVTTRDMAFIYRGPPEAPSRHSGECYCGHSAR